MNNKTELEISRVFDILYAAISGPAGSPRTWEIHRDLFVPGATLGIVHLDGTGKSSLELLSVEEYRTSRQPFFEETSFYEHQTRCEVRVAGTVAQAFSHFVCRRSLHEVPFASGINSALLVAGVDRWRLTSMVWEATAAASSLPPIRRVQLS